MCTTLSFHHRHLLYYIIIIIIIRHEKQIIIKVHFQRKNKMLNVTALDQIKSNRRRRYLFITILFYALNIRKKNSIFLFYFLSNLQLFFFLLFSYLHYCYMSTHTQHRTIREKHFPYLWWWHFLFDKVNRKSIVRFLSVVSIGCKK